MGAEQETWEMLGAWEGTGGLWHSAGRCTHIRMRSLGGSNHFCASHFAF